MDKIEQLKKEMKEIGDKKVLECGFVKGDCVVLKGKDGKEEKCRVTSVYGYEGKLVIILRNNNVRSIGWSSNTYYLNDTNSITKIECPTINIEQLGNQMEGLESEKRKIAEEVNGKISSLKQKITEEQNKCIHDWDEGYETGTVVKHFIGETEVKEFTCQICGKVGQNC